MTTFDDRENTFEKKYAHDAELRFKVVARRNKLLGQWVAAQLGKSGADAEAYAKEVVMADFEKPGDDDVLQKVLADLQAAGVATDRDALRIKMNALLEAAKHEMAAKSA